MNRKCVKIKRELDIFSLNFTIRSRDEFMDSLKFVYDELYHRQQNKSNSVLPEESRMREELRKPFDNFLINQVIHADTMNIMMYFLNNIITSLLEGYHEYKGVKSHLLFRGGNVLKIYKDEFENQITRQKRKVIREYFNEYFTASDLDFMIFVEDENR